MIDYLVKSYRMYCDKNEANVLKPFNIFNVYNIIVYILLVVLIYTLPPDAYNADRDNNKSIVRSAIVGIILYFYVMLFVVIFFNMFMCFDYKK